MNVAQFNSDGQLVLSNNKASFPNQQGSDFTGFDDVPKARVVIPSAFGLFFAIALTCICCAICCRRRQQLRAWGNQNNAQRAAINNIYPNYHSPHQPTVLHSPPAEPFPTSTQASWAIQQPQAPYPSQQFPAPYPSQQSQAPYPSQQFQPPYPSQQSKAPYPIQQSQAPYPSEQCQTSYPSEQSQAPYNFQQFHGHTDDPNAPPPPMMFPSTPPPNYDESNARLIAHQSPGVMHTANHDKSYGTYTNDQKF